MICDFALYAYTHKAHEGGFSLENYPGIQAWISRIEAMPGFAAMP
jgi:glutathione S-transferase